MRSSFLSFAAVVAFLSTGCLSGQPAYGAAAPRGVESIYTSLNAQSCKAVTDEKDPNELTYQVCPGVAAYQLQIRPIESGRLSIGIVTPAKRRIDLDFGNVITRSMDGVDEKAEWRVRREKGRAVPFALIVRVLVHENTRTPEKVTQAYWVVARLSKGKACVTDRILQESTSSSHSVVEIRALADSAISRPCLARLQ